MIARGVADGGGALGDHGVQNIAQRGRGAGRTRR
jgi:hypothetical protein